MTDKASLLAEAEAAYHQLMTGRKVVSLRDQNGETVTYNQASASKLMAYITTLKNEIADVRPPGPMRIFF